MKIIDYFSPEKGSAVVPGLLYAATRANGFPSGFLLMRNGYIKSVEHSVHLFGVENDPETEWTFDTPLITRIIAETTEVPVMLALIRYIWAFSPSTSDDEISMWDKTIKEHPNATRIFEMLLMCKSGRKHWIVNSPSPINYDQKRDVHLIEEQDTIDHRFASPRSMEHILVDKLGMNLTHGTEKTPRQQQVVPFRKKTN